MRSLITRLTVLTLMILASLTVYSKGFPDVKSYPPEQETSAAIDAAITSPFPSAVNAITAVGKEAAKKFPVMFRDDPGKEYLPARGSGFMPPPACTLYVNDNSLAGDQYTTAIGNDANTGGAADPYATIQKAIDEICSGGLILVDAGTYEELLAIADDDLILRGAGIDVTVIDYSSFNTTTNGNSAVNITGHGVNLKGFTVMDDPINNNPRYGLKVGVSASTTDNVVLDSIKVTGSYRTGIDLARPGNITLRDIYSIDNGGAGIFMTNVAGATLENITTSGNPWTGVSVSSRSDWPGSTSGVVFTGTNSFGENGDKNGGVQIESDVTLPISWSNTIADGADVTIQQSELAYVLSGPTTSTFGSITYAPYYRFYETIAQAQSAAGMGPDHVDIPRYIRDANASTLPSATSFYVFDFSDTAMTIQAAVDAAVGGNTVIVSAGTYEEDVLVNKSLTLQGAGIGQSTIEGPIGGGNAGVRVAAPNVVVEGFTITREGNNPGDWNDANLNSAGVAIQGQAVNGEIRNNEIIGNRTAIDVNNSNGNNIHNNIIHQNHSGLLFRNQTDSTNLQENEITDNRTVGVLFLDASGGTNSPVQSALYSSFNNNNISGNWYGEVVDRQAGGSLPPPGSYIKDFECNWYGSASPVVSTNNSAEPGYSTHIPTYYGGTASDPGNAPDILGPASANIDYIYFLVEGTDSDGALGFQPEPGACKSADCPDGSCEGCFVLETFDESINSGTTQAPDTWYTDRYEPDSFYVDLGNEILVHSIASSDGGVGAFQLTQGKKYDLAHNTQMLSIDLYVPSSWETTGRRMAGLWGVAFDGTNTISGYPIIEYTSDNGTPRFRVYEGDGSWVDMGLPCDFAYDEWHTLRIELLPTGEFRYSVDDLRMSSTLHGVNGSEYFGNVILQGHNTAAGVDYEIHWDNFLHGNGPVINYDHTLPEPITVGSGISNQHMVVGEYCGITSGVKAFKRFLGDVTPVNGNTYQFGTGVSPQSAANSAPDSGTARWNFLYSVNLGDYTFNDLNVFIEVDFDPSDELCQTGPYVVNLSQFLIDNSMGGQSSTQGSENIGFDYWQAIGDPAILPFDPYAEGVYDITLRIENKDGVELMDLPIHVEVDCDYIDPSEDLEPAALVCPADTVIHNNMVSDPWLTGMAYATNGCGDSITYSDDNSGLTGCNGTGTLVRTWTLSNGDSTQTCDQNITIIDTTAPILISCPSDRSATAFDGSCGAVVNFTEPISYDLQYFEGFEDPDFQSGDGSYEGWNNYNSPMMRVASGTDGITSLTGSAHAVIDTNGSNGTTGAFGRLGGYSSTFGNGFIAAQAVYIDLNDAAVIANEYGWDLSAAATGKDGGHQRDFIFHAASNSDGNVLIGGSNNTDFSRKTNLDAGNHYEITTSGWYTFQWVFRDSAGVLAVDLNLLNNLGMAVWTETRYNPIDLIATEVGGNRYMWFTFLEVERLHIDNTVLINNVSVNCTAHSGDTFSPGTTTVTCTVTDSCGNSNSCSFDVTVQNYYVERFNEPVNTSASQASDTWYTDRYAPDSFYVDVFDGDSALIHSIAASDGTTNRPGSYSSPFYDTQGRKYDLENVQLLSIELYVPSDWETTGRRMAGLWGTAFDSAGTENQAYPIVEFTSLDGDPRFRGWNDTGWVDMGLPCDFAYDEWHTLRMELLPNGEFRYSVDDDLRFTTTEHAGLNTAYFGNVILQGHNTSAGVDYDIHWDNLIYGDAPELYYDHMLPDPIVVGSGISNENMAVAEYCEMNGGIKAFKRFLGDVEPVDGDVPDDTYQFGTGVSPTDASNTTPDPGKARWNVLLSVNLGNYTFNDLNVFLDVDFDPSDSACGVGPYEANISELMINGGNGDQSFYQASENLGFDYWQLIGDSAILPFDPYAEGVYDLTLRVETHEGLELMDIPIRVEVGCEFVDPEDDLEAPVLACPADTTIHAGTSTDPWRTGMATASGSCEQNISFSDSLASDDCGESGTIIRTWTMVYGDDTSNCDQTITIIDTTGPVFSNCPSDTTLYATSEDGAVFYYDPPIATDVLYFEGFEHPDFESGPGNYKGWNDYNSPLERVASGTGGVTSSSGGSHGVIDTNGSDGGTGAFNRLGGYRGEFGGGFTTSQDVYVDVNDPAVVNDTYGWDLSSAASTQSGGHLRDFVFHAASNGSGHVLIAGSNNSTGARRNDLGSLNHYEIGTSGWYTFESVFRDSAGALAVDLNLKDASGNLLWKETRYNAADLTATVVGGNRYLWFIFLETEMLAIDNTSLFREASLNCTAASGDTFSIGTTTVSCSATDSCGNTSSCSFDVLVTDTAGALNFDGANDVVSVPHDASLTGFGTTITVEAWVKPEDLNGRQGVVSKWNDLGGNNRRSYLLWADEDDVQFYISGNGTDFPSAKANSQLTIGEWTHIAGTFDGSTIRVYVNGNLAASQSYSGSIANNTADPLLIGAADGGGTSRQNFDGTVDEVRIYDRVLCEAEIQAHMNCELSGTENGLRAYYDFNHGFGDADNSGLDSLEDRTANNNDGTLQNFTLNGTSSNWTYQYDSISGDCAPFEAASIAVTGNGQGLSDGQTATSTADSTDFGTVGIGSSNTNSFYIVNNGNDTLVVSDTTITGADAAQFSFSGLSSAAIAAGDSARLDITYSPSGASVHTATVHIVSNDCLTASFDFAIEGTGESLVVDCDTVRIISDGSWMMSTTVTTSSYSGNWSGVNGNLPAMATFTQPVTLGQPYNFPTIYPVDSAQVISAGNNIRYFSKSFHLDTLVDIGARIRATFDDQVEIYVNGILLTGHYTFGKTNDEMPAFDAEFQSNGTVNNGAGGNRPFNYATSDTLDNVFQPGMNDVVVVLRNLAKPSDAGGFSLSLQVDGCEGVTPGPDTTVVPTDTLCDTVRVVSNSDWSMSTIVTPSSYSGNWSGVNGNLPALGTFTDPVTLGQPYNFQTIYPVDSSDVIKAGNNIRYFHRSISLDSLVNIGAQIRSTFDDQAEVYVNGHLLVGHYQFTGNNGKMPPFDAEFSGDGSVDNGVGANKAYDFATSDTLDGIFQPGTNNVIVVLRNLAKSTDAGGFSLSLEVSGCKGEVVPDTTTPTPEDSLTMSIVSDNGWSKSTEVQPSGLSGNWNGAASLPDTSTYTLAAEEGQPYSFPTIDPIDSAKVIKTESNITFFRREFTLTDHEDLNARFRMNVDDGMEIYLNGVLIARENNSGSQNFRNPHHDLKFFGGIAPVNGFNGNDAFDVVANLDLDTVLETGDNELVVAVRNKGKDSDLGGFSFRLDLDKAGSEVIVKSAGATADAGAGNQLDFELYPNPTSGIVNIILSGEIAADSEIIVQDASGRVITRGSFERFSRSGSLQVDMSGYAAGIYLIRIKSADTYRAKRLMKN